MAEVKIDEHCLSLDPEFKKTLADTFDKLAPNVRVDANAAFKYFQRRVYAHCSVWEEVPDSCVKP